VAADTPVWPGDSYPLGASYDGAGTNFALFSEIAEQVELCLFADDGAVAQGRNQALLEFVRWLVQFRADQPVFRRRRFFQGQDIRGVPSQLRDIAWFTPAGQEMTEADWQAGSASSLAVFMNGDAISEPDRRGEPVRSDSFLLLFNASELDLGFTLPPPRYGARWSKVLDTAVPLISAQDVAVVKPGDVIGVPSRSIQVLSRNRIPAWPTRGGG
jgi:isoamylase